MMFKVAGRSAKQRILDFDLENRPLTYWYADVTTPEITAIAWSWYGEDEVQVATLYPPMAELPYEQSAIDMLLAFRAAFVEADMVTGHYIRKHDLPLINAGLMEYNLPLLTAKLTSDTKLDLVKRSGLPVSQQALGYLFETKKPKVAMPTAKWRDANRLTPEGIELTIARVKGDVMQHKEIRRELLERKLLGPPRLWIPHD